MDSDLGSTSLPLLVLAPVSLVLAAVFGFVLLGATRNTRLRLVLFVPWLRYLMTFFHAITFKSAVGGLTWMALTSATAFVAGLCIIQMRDLLLKRLIPIYCVVAVVVLSGLANHTIGGTIDAVVKFGYLLVIAILLYECLGEAGEAKVGKLLLWPYVTPFVMLLLSIPLGVVKASERDGSASYIGGYSHESGFSIVLLTCFAAASFATKLNRSFRFCVMAASVIGIVLANYRTTILAVIPLLLVVVNQELLAPLPRQQRRILVVVTGFLTIMAIAGLAYLERERFADMASAFDPWDRMLKPPSEFTPDDRALFSGRAFIWSSYIYGWIEGGTLNHMVGFGANSWQGVFPLYAHNTLVSSLYEYGPLGVLAMLYLWASMAWAAFTARRGPERTLMLGAHASFFILNMATMPHWAIEGDILYGIIIGYTLHLARRTVLVPAAAAPKKQRERIGPLRIPGETAPAIADPVSPRAAAGASAAPAGARPVRR
jgi:hypothetical protein